MNISEFKMNPHTLWYGANNTTKATICFEFSLIDDTVYIKRNNVGKLFNNGIMSKKYRWRINKKSENNSIVVEQQDKTEYTLIDKSKLKSLVGDIYHTDITKLILSYITTELIFYMNKDSWESEVGTLVFNTKLIIIRFHDWKYRIAVNNWRNKLQ